MEYLIIDAHTHLWRQQDTTVDGLAIKTTDRGRSEFMGEMRQMLPPFMTDGVNSPERIIANMDYAQVAAAVVTQEFIDGNQNDYLHDAQSAFKGRLLCCALIDMREDNFHNESIRQMSRGFKAMKIPAQRLISRSGRISLVSDDAMRLYKEMERNGVILSIDLADGDTQVGEMKEIIAECPNLKIAIGHFGMVTRPKWTEQIKLARNKNVFIESGGITWLFNDEFYPFPSAIKAIREAAGLVGMDKLMWGSDYPRTIVAITYKMSYDFIVKSSLLTDEEKAKFLGLNAERFYGFHGLSIPPYIKNMSE